MTNEAYTLPEGYSLKAETHGNDSVRLTIMDDLGPTAGKWHVESLHVRSPEDLPAAMEKLISVAEKREEGFRTAKARLAEVQGWLIENVPGHRPVI